MVRSKKEKAAKLEPGSNAAITGGATTTPKPKKNKHRDKRIRNKASGDGGSEAEETQEGEEEESILEDEEEEAVPPPSAKPVVDDATIELWKSVYEMEKNRFSFFDELFSSGHVVDSLEVMSQGPKEPTPHFVEAEEEDFLKKTDYGRTVMKTKHVYTGNFDDWYFQGPGRYVWVDGTIYQGDFKNGVMHGRGAIHWPDGSVYEGEFDNGDRTPGWNVYSTPDGFTYAGEWQKGLPHGKGKIWYDPAVDDTDYYEGSWANGVQNGFGVRQYPNGDRYIGNWEVGERSGQGTMIWLEERQVYKGQWQNGIPNGKGRHIWYLERTECHVFPSRHVYFGDWEDGKRHGIGKMVYPCGSTYEGRWKDGQRHGKGVFLNPAGSLITGLFKDGDLVGGSGVPLHAPTYDCDFGGLVEYLTSKFHLSVENEAVEEQKLKETVIRFLEPLRNLYQRAGELAHNWGNNGLYPHWLKVSQGSDHRISNHHEKSIPAHMEAKSINPPSPDGIYPVTRMGLWLLLRDCPRLNSDVTIAYFDKHFGNQSYQCMNFSPTIPPSSYWASFFAGDTPSISFQTRHNPFEPVLLWQFLQCLVIVGVSIFLEIPNRKRRLKYSTSGKQPKVTSANQTDRIVEDNHPTNTHKKQGAKRNKSFSMKRRNTHRKISGSKKKASQDKEDASAALTDEEEDATHAEDDKEHLRNETEEDVEINPDTDPKKPLRDKSGKQGRDRSKISQKKSEWGDEDPSDSGDDTLGLFSPETQAKNAPYKLSISEAFEAFLIEKLFPCLEVQPGKNLPMVPNPLPPLRDTFEVFQKLNGGTELISANHFMQTVLPHLIQPKMEEVLFWHRCPEILSRKVNFDEILRPKKKQSLAQKDTILNNEEINVFPSDSEVLNAMNLNEGDEDEDQNDDFLGGRPHHVSLSEKFPTISEDDSDNNQVSAEVMEFVADPLPFADQDLPPEPFLWDEERKCIPLLQKSDIMKTNSNLTSDDVINILRTLYPQLVGKPGETNVHFDMVYCDWLWGMSLVAKLSVDREMEGKIGTPLPPTRPVNDVNELA